MFTTLLRKPDLVVGATENTDIRFEERPFKECPVKYDYVVGKDSAKVIVYPSGSPVKYLKLRFRGDFANVTRSIIVLFYVEKPRHSIFCQN